MSASLSFEHREDGLVLIAGELSLAEAPILEQRLAELLEGTPPAIIVDLAGVEFIDSSGLSVLIRAQQQASARGVTFGVQNPRSQAHRLFSLTGLEERLTGVAGADPDATWRRDERPLGGPTG